MNLVVPECCSGHGRTLSNSAHLESRPSIHHFWLACMAYNYLSSMACVTPCPIVCYLHSSGSSQISLGTSSIESLDVAFNRLFRMIFNDLVKVIDTFSQLVVCRSCITHAPPSQIYRSATVYVCSGESYCRRPLATTGDSFGNYR